MNNNEWHLLSGYSVPGTVLSALHALSHLHLQKRVRCLLLMRKHSKIREILQFSQDNAANERWRKHSMSSV